jgi:hypothetical protein
MLARKRTTAFEIKRLETAIRPARVTRCSVGLARPYCGNYWTYDPPPSSVTSEAHGACGAAGTVSFGQFAHDLD